MNLQHLSDSHYQILIDLDNHSNTNFVAQYDAVYLEHLNLFNDALHQENVHRYNEIQLTWIPILASIVEDIESSKVSDDA
jgi:hypothetical protein